MTGERCIVREDESYPESLRRISSPPRRLYVRGALPDAKLPSVAVIGARSCSAYGREMAQWFAEELAAAGVQIISGMALGVDGIAQRAAIAAGGRSFAVLGCGTDICYPRDNRPLYEELLERGGILSEHPVGTPPISRHFPSRNRIISALSDIVLVIEAKEKSGTLITVDFALEQGKDVYALPGRLTDTLSCGCNRLLRQGAGIAMTPSDILEALPGELTGRLRQRTKTAETAKLPDAAKPFYLQQKEYLVWEQLGDRPITPQELYEKVRASENGRNTGLQELMDVLVDLQLKGMIGQERGGQYQKKKGICVLSV